MKKKLLALFLVLVMLLGTVATVRAEEAEEPQIVAKGKIEMCNWTLYDDGNLLLDGTLIVSVRCSLEELRRADHQGLTEGCRFCHQIAG